MLYLDESVNFHELFEVSDGAVRCVKATVIRASQSRQPTYSAVRGWRRIFRRGFGSCWKSRIMTPSP